METVGFIGIITGMIARFWPVWMSLAIVLRRWSSSAGRGSACSGSFSTAASARPAS